MSRNKATKKPRPKAGSAARRILRVIDANINRLREALRVVEEYFRLIVQRPQAAQACKTLRHALAAIEQSLRREALLDSRDTTTDPFAGADHKETFSRKNSAALFYANCKRGQEAARTIEEYCKVLSHAKGCAQSAKHIRFALYELEKQSITETNL